MSEKIWVCDDEPSTRFPVYTRGNVGEVFVEAVSPLTWSAYGPNSWEAGWRDAFCEIGLFTREEFGPPERPMITGCFGGYVYINMSVTRVMAVRIPGMTVEAIDKSLFGDYPDVPAYRPHPQDQNAERSAQALVWLQSLFTVDPKPVTDEDRVRLDAIAARRPAFGALSDAQLLEYFRALLPEARRVFKRHVLNSYGANVLASVILQICQAVGATDFAAKVTAAVGGIDSAEQSYDLWELSRQVQSSPTVARAFDQGVEGLLERLRALPDPSARRFLERWDEFIGRWGFIGPSVWELRSTTYALTPEIPLRMLDRARQASDTAAPSVRSAELIAEREAAIAEIARRLAGNADVQGQFMGAARSAGNYLAGRERSKMHCTLVIEEGRKALRELGKRMVKRGHISRWEHVLLVTNAEADAFVADPASFAARIVERAQRLELLRSKEPPFVFEGAVPPLSTFKDRGSGKIEIAGPGTRLTGLGVSPGSYTGRARVIASLGVDSELEPGEVIVAEITDASWGPLFLAAGAVVVETGATISHAAIVSRELGIPAVVSVTDVTRRIRDGSRITVDGSAGTVTVE
jgi:pyruvate,water dikinase